MPVFFKLYMTAWITITIVALILMYRHRASIELFSRVYWQHLLQGWKVVTFLISGISMVVMAPYTGDPTWDYVDASFMSILTFATAPWAVGSIFRHIRFNKNWLKLFIVVSVWMFSVSWSYDGYMVWRDGYYPITWLPNIFASSVLYCCAGLFWSLEWRTGRGVHFGFTEKNWPLASEGAQFGKLIWYGLPFMILVAAMIVPFLL